MKTKVKKWGSSVAVRIPASVVQALHLDLNDVVDIREEGGRIIIEPVQQKVHDVTELVCGISKNNQHHSVDFGLPLGKEIC